MEGRDVVKRDTILSAAISGKLNRLKKLIAKYDDGRGPANTVMSIKDDNGVGVIHFAAEQGKLNVLRYLIEELGLDVNMKNDAKGYTEILTRLLSRGVNVNGSCEDGTLTPLAVAGATLSPLDVAANNGQIEAIQILLDHNADPNLMSCRSFTSLAVSIKSGRPQSLRCVELLLEAGADPDGGSYGITPLVVATCKGLTEIIRRLIQAGANPDVTNCFGLTPLEIAASKGNHHDVEILFPVTSRIPGYIDWSVGGVITHVQSDQAMEQWKLNAVEKFHESKLNGADAFKEQDYNKALFWYCQAIHIAPSDANVLSNLSMCWARLKDGEQALEAAEACIFLRPDWPKAYYRAGVAYSLLKRYSSAQEAFLEGLKLSPNNQEIKAAFREAVEAQLNTVCMT